MFSITFRTMVKTRRLYVSSVFVTGVILTLCCVPTGTIMCYQCGGSQQSSDCVNDVTGMMETFITYNLTGTNMTTADIGDTKYLKNCDGLNGYGSWGYGNYCIIQEIRFLDQTVEFIRDCSDGKRFPVYGLPYFPLKADEIPADNITRRGALNASLSFSIYITKCSEDLCNGPQVEYPVIKLRQMNQVSSSQYLYIDVMCHISIFLLVMFFTLDL